MGAGAGFWSGGGLGVAVAAVVMCGCSRIGCSRLGAVRDLTSYEWSALRLKYSVSPASTRPARADLEVVDTSEHWVPKKHDPSMSQPLNLDTADFMRHSVSEAVILAIGLEK